MLRLVTPSFMGVPSMSSHLLRPVSKPMHLRVPSKAFAARSLHVQVAAFARQNPRTRVRTRTQEVTRSDTDHQVYQEQRHYEEEESYGGGEPSDDGTQEDAIGPETRTHLTKVYGTMMAGMGFAAVGSAVGMLAPGLSIIGLIGGFLGVLGIAFTDPSKVTLRQNMFMGSAGLMGLGIAPILAISAPGVIFSAALGTAAIFGGFTLAALKAKRRSMLMLAQGPLLGGLMVVFMAGLGSMLLPFLGVTSPAILGALYNVNLYGGLALFSMFISYDTQQMIEAHQAGNNDHVTPALNMFLNLFNIFIRLLQIFRGDE